MSDRKLTELPAVNDSEVSGTILVYVVININGVKISKQMTLEQLKEWINSPTKN